MKSASLASLRSPLADVSFPPDVPRLMAVAAPTSLRVLVAEDQPLLRRIMVRTIEKLGHQAIAAEDGTRAWELFAENPADVVITDWLMPGMDGLDLCRRLRAECGDSSPYVILASVLDDPRDVRSGLSAGADEYLVKPIATEALAARLIAVERMLRDHVRAKAARLVLASEVRQALEQGDLALHYQPKVDLSSGAPVGVEALARWPHPTQGWVPPDTFVALAEETGLICPLSQWVLETAVHQAKAWDVAGLEMPIAVNLSVYDLEDPAVPQMLAELLRRSRTSPERLHPDDTEAATIVQSTIHLAHALGLSVVAEGVENQRNMDLLAQFGCDTAQGFHVCRPLVAIEAARWLRQRSAAAGSLDRAA